MVVRRDEAYEEQGQFIAWIFWTIVWTLVSFYLLLILNMTLLHWIREGFSIMSLNSAFAFWKNSFLHPSSLIDTYANWFHQVFKPGVPMIFYLPFLSFIIPVFIFIIGMLTNPYE